VERDRSSDAARRDASEAPPVHKQPVASFVRDTSGPARMPSPRRATQYATPNDPRPLYDPTTFVAAIVMFAVALTTAGTLVRTVHRAEGWDLRLFIPPLAGSGVGPGITAIVLLGVGAHLMRGALQTLPRPKAVLGIASSCLLGGLALAAQAAGIVTSGTVMLLSLAFVALGVTAELSARGMAAWAGSKGGAIAMAAVAGAAFFVFVEIVIGALQ
jgi:hypothetical protein